MSHNIAEVDTEEVCSKFSKSLFTTLHNENEMRKVKKATFSHPKKSIDD